MNYDLRQNHIVTNNNPTIQQWLSKTLTNHSSVKGYLEPVIQMINPNWQSHGFLAKVIEKRIENEWVFSLVLQPQKKWPSFKAGQYIELQVEINGVRYTRIFSISSSPSYYLDSGLIELTIRRQAHGKVTPWLSTDLSKNSTVRISRAQGDFVLPKYLSNETSHPLLFIAGGSGITPFRSFLHELADQNTHQDVHLIYYNQSSEPLFAEEWQQLAEQIPNLKINLIDTSIVGQINTEQLSKLCPDYINRLAYICGPHGLITSSRDILIDLNVNDSNIRHELFGPKPITELSRQLDGEITFTRSGTQASYTADQNKTLLELAEANDTNPISGCRMGVCHQCKCHKQQGVIYNTLTESYSDTGAEDIQLCISVAVGDVSLDL